MNQSYHMNDEMNDELSEYTAAWMIIGLNTHQATPHKSFPSAKITFFSKEWLTSQFLSEAI